MDTNQPLIPKHGGYRNLKSFQVAQLAYDVTVRFCDRYIDRRSRTRDQMVQAARSGVQNIAEGSQASGTSKKMELKLTNVARASLEELRLDYEDFLRQRDLEAWAPNHPALQRFKAKRCSTLEEVRQWVEEERAIAHARTRPSPSPSVPVRVSPCSSVSSPSPSVSSPSPSVSSPSLSSPSVSSAQLVANAALSLLNLACYLLDRQIASQAQTFEHEGGFTERLYRVRTARRASRE